MDTITPYTAAASVSAAIMNPGLAAGGLYRVEGRTVRLERVHDSGVVELVDQLTLGTLQVKCPSTGTAIAPTIEWLRERYREGALVPLETPVTPPQQQGQYALLDPDALVDGDPKATWRHSLAMRAMADEALLTDHACEVWLDDNYGKEISDFAFKRPSGATLRRWMRSLKNKGKKVSTLAARTGRKKGHSQLEPVLDAFVHEAALYYWTRPRVQIVNAYAWLDEQIEAYNATLAAGQTGLTLPSKETLRKRVHRLRCYDTVKAKWGESKAQELFRGSGEPLLVSDLLEVVLMDATMLEQVIVFDDDWQLPACRVRITALMDALSHAILGWHVYAGPTRAETSIEAIIAAASPPDVPAHMLAKHPMLGFIWGKPAAILPDNEKALIGPATLPALNEAGIDLLEPPIEMPTAKAALERFFRTLKESLMGAPGTLIDPKRALELDYDAVDAACLTLPQLRVLVSKVVADYNVATSKGLNDQSPALVWSRRACGRATLAFHDIARLRRILGKTSTALLTRDGIEVNRIRYRDAVLVTALLDNMASTQKVRGRRKDGSVTIEVKVRVSPGNLDSIQVFDEVANEWVMLPSTQPLYTAGLSEWGHREFGRQSKRRNEPFASQNDRLTSKASTLRMIDEMAPKLGFQQRRDLATLYMSQQVKKLAGSAASLLPPVPIAGVASSASQISMENDRTDDGLPAGAPDKDRETKARHQAPQRADGYGDDRTPSEDEAIDWDDLEIFDNNDPETGVEEPIVSPEQPMEEGE